MSIAALIRTQDTGDTQARKTCLRSVISRIEVDDQKIRIFGDRATLADVVAGRQSQAGNIRGFEGNGAPCGNRTRLCRVRGGCPEPIDERSGCARSADGFL